MLLLSTIMAIINTNLCSMGVGCACSRQAESRCGDGLVLVIWTFLQQENQSWGGVFADSVISEQMLGRSPKGDSRSNNTNGHTHNTSCPTDVVRGAIRLFPIEQFIIRGENIMSRNGKGDTHVGSNYCLQMSTVWFWTS